MSELEVVFGAGTQLGGCVARNLADAGRAVRAVVGHRNVAQEHLPSSVEIVEGDPLDPGVVEDACQGATTIYHCMVFRHHKWKGAAQPVMNNILGYAIRTGTKFFFADPVYDAPSFVNNFDGETLDAQRQGLTEVLVARLPQLYGPGIRNILFDEVYDAVLSNKRAYWIENLDVPRDLLYIEDAGRACAALGMSPKAYGRKWDISAGTPLTGRQFIKYAFELAGKVPDLGIWRNRLLRVAGILDYDSKEMGELPYDYSQSMILDPVDFNTTFPSFEYTPIDAGLRETFEWYRNFLKPHSLRQKILPLTSLPI